MPGAIAEHVPRELAPRAPPTRRRDARRRSDRARRTRPETTAPARRRRVRVPDRRRGHHALASASSRARRSSSRIRCIAARMLARQSSGPGLLAPGIVQRAARVDDGAEPVRDRTPARPRARPRPARRIPGRGARRSASAREAAPAPRDASRPRPRRRCRIRPGPRSRGSSPRRRPRRSRTACGPPTYAILIVRRRRVARLHENEHAAAVRGRRPARTARCRRGRARGSP